MRLLKYQNKKESHDITLNLNTYIDNIHVFLDPAIEKNGILKQLKKKRIIKEITGYIFYNNTNIPIATLNIGILRKYDAIGVKKFLENIGGMNH